MYKYILFDFDGTLINSNEIIIKTLQATTLKYRGDQLTAKEVNNLMGRPLLETMMLIDKAQAEVMIDYYRQYSRSHRDDFTYIFDGIKEMLLELKEKGIMLAIVSNKGSNGIRHGIGKFGLEGIFDTIVSADDVEKKKPYADPALKAMAALKASADSCLFVGDSIHDIECAKNAHIKTVLVNWSIIDKKELFEASPDYIIHTPNELIDIIEASKEA